MNPVEALHRPTSVVRSTILSERVGTAVDLKMETEQPVRSFKIRGIGRLAQNRARAGATGLTTSSGGNAGYAVAHAGLELGLPVTVVVPRTTPEFMRAKLRSKRAQVIEHGNAWDDAHALAVAMSEESGSAYVHPFDDPEIWHGHSTIITEDAEHADRPSQVIVAVGGGGLLCGVLEGLHRVGWNDVPVLAVETDGAASFAGSLEHGRLITLDAITSIATTLGARSVAPKALEWAEQHPIESVLVSDAMALRACKLFREDHGEWVEPSCGAALAVTYGGLPILASQGRVLVIVCGGAGVDEGLIEEWSTRIEA